MIASGKSYKELASRAIADERLKENLKVIQQRIGKGTFAFWQDERNNQSRYRVKEQRLRSLDHLDVLLAELAGKVREQGGKVYFAASAEDATAYIAKVANTHQVKRVIKGKSMTSHEIGLHPVFE